MIPFKSLGEVQVNKRRSTNPSPSPKPRGVMGQDEQCVLLLHTACLMELGISLEGGRRGSGGEGAQW
jgi:hypothetical protein